jgi:hypothetical protein
MAERDITPDRLMDDLRQFRRQIRSYTGRTERGQLTDTERARWRDIKKDYDPDVPEIFAETL